MKECGLGPEKLPIRIDAAGKRLREPVQRHRVQDVVERRRHVRPREELLADPGEECERRAGEGQADGGGPRAVLAGVGVAEGAEIGIALEAGLFFLGERRDRDVLAFVDADAKVYW